MFVGLLLLWPGSARADCTSPAATAGTIEYFSTTDEKVHRYCDGTNWTSWAGRSIAGIPAPIYSSAGGVTLLPQLLDVDDAMSPGAGNVLLYSGGQWTAGAGGGGGDDLGDHTATQNILLGTNYLSRTGTASKGLSFDASDNASLSDALTIGGALAVTGDISPASIGADQNNYAPTGHATASVMRLTASGGYQITGLAGGVDGRIVTLVNIGASSITLRDENASSTAANRFALAGNITLAQDQSVVLLYDATASRWRAMAVYGPAAATLNDLTDVDTTGATAGDVLLYSGGSWVPGTASGGGGGNKFAFHHRKYNHSGSGVVNFDGASEKVDTDNVFNITTDRFIPTEAGFYYIAASGWADQCQSTDEVFLDIVLNGSNYVTGHASNGTWSSGYGSLTTSVSAIIEMNGTTDYVELQANEDCNLEFEEIDFSGFKLADGGGGGSADNLGDHTATQNILLGTNYLSQTGSASKGLSFDGSDNALLSDGLSVGGTAALTGDISPASIGANQNNYAPTGLAGASVLRLTASGAYNITGLGGGTDGRIITLVNIGANAITLMDENASSTAANRFALAGNITLAQDQSAVLLYDATASRWRAMAVYGPAAATLNDLTDVDTTGATAGDVLLYSGGSWVPGTASGGGGGGPATIVSARYSTSNGFNTAGSVVWSYSSGTSAAGIFDGNTTTNVANMLDDVCVVELSAISYLLEVKVYRSGSNALYMYTSIDGQRWAATSNIQAGNPTTYDGMGFFTSDRTGVFHAAKYVAVGSANESCREVQVTAIETGGGGGDSLWSAGAGNDIYYNSGTPMVGIGTTDPTAALHVVGDILFTGSARDISDIRLKENIKPVETALDRLMKLEAISFTMKDDPQHRTEFGFSAQQLLQIYPDLVTTADNPEKTLSVNYIGMVAPLVRAIQEQQTQIEALQKQIEALEARPAPLPATVPNENKEQ